MKSTSIFIFVFSFFLFSAGIQAQDLAERLEAHTALLAADSLEGRGLGTRGKEIAADYIVSKFQEVGISPLDGTYEFPFRFRTSQAWIDAVNVVGVIEGKDADLADEIIVVGAHYDHIGYRIEGGEKIIYNGADDNASGVAGIIEIGRILAAQKENIKRTVVFVAFDAEESGLIGSTRFVKDSIVDVDAIKFMFSLDMIGMYGANGGLDLKGIEALKQGADLAMASAGKHGIKIKKMGSDFERRTDTSPFAERGIPTAHVFTGLKSPYHKPEDTYEKLDYPNMAKVTEFTADLVLSMANAEVLTAKPAYAKIEEGQTLTTKRVRFGAILNIGAGYHNFRDNNLRTNTAFNVSAGFGAQFKISDVVTIQPEVLYDLNRSKVLNENFSRQALTIPINIQVGPGMTAPGVRFYALGGPYYRYILDASEGGQAVNVGTFINQDEWGYSFGFGIDINKFTVAWTLRRGLTSVSDRLGNDIRDKGSNLTLSYWF